MNANGESMKTVYTVVDRGSGKSHWTRIGVGFVNRDGSLNLKLDALPTNGTLQVREWEDRDSLQRHGEGPPGSMPRARPRDGLATPGPNRGGNEAGGLA